MHKNTTALRITMLGCLEIDKKILDTNIKSMESNDCRKISRNNSNTNGMLAMM